jgi:hypothetical protein
MSLHEDIESAEYQCIVFIKLHRILLGAKYRARDRGCDFNLDFEYVCELYTEICPVLGIELVWDNSGPVCPGSPSLDRINNTLGYVKGNVQIISHRANTLKKDWLADDWRKMSAYMLNGKTITIGEEHFKEPIESLLTLREARDIKREWKGGEKAETISCACEIPGGKVLRYIKHLESENKAKNSEE